MMRISDITGCAIVLIYGMVGAVIATVVAVLISMMIGINNPNFTLVASLFGLLGGLGFYIYRSQNR